MGKKVSTDQSCNKKNTFKTGNTLRVMDLPNMDASSESAEKDEIDARFLSPVSPNNKKEIRNSLIKNRIIDLESNLKNIVDVCNELMEKVEKL